MRRTTRGAVREEVLAEHKGLVCEPGKDFASCSGKMGAIDCLTPEIWSGLCGRRVPWALCGERVLGEQGQKPTGELGGCSSGQGGSLGGRVRAGVLRKMHSFPRGAPEASVKVHRWGLKHMKDKRDQTRGPEQGAGRTVLL